VDNYCRKLSCILYTSVHQPYCVLTLITVHSGLCPLLSEQNHTTCATTKKTKIWHEGTVSFLTESVQVRTVAHNTRSFVTVYIHTNINPLVACHWQLAVCHAFESNVISTVDKFVMRLSVNVVNSMFYRNGFFAFCFYSRSIKIYRSN